MLLLRNAAVAVVLVVVSACATAPAQPPAGTSSGVSPESGAATLAPPIVVSTPAPTAPALPTLERASYDDFVAWRQRYSTAIDAAIGREDWPEVQAIRREAMIGAPLFYDTTLVRLRPQACYADAALAWDHALSTIETWPPPNHLPGDEPAPSKSALRAWHDRTDPPADCANADPATPAGPREFWDPQPPPDYREYGKWWQGQGLHPDVWIAAVAAWDEGHHERVAVYDAAAKAKDAVAARAAALAVANWNEHFSRFVHFENNVDWPCYDVHEPLNRADWRVQYGLALADAWAARKPARALAELPYWPEQVQAWWVASASDLADPVSIGTACQVRD